MSWLDAPLLRALRTPTEARRFLAQDWELAILQARSSQLLGRLGALLNQAGVEVPPAARRHFTAMDSIVQRQHGAVRWEVRQIARAMAAIETPLLLLKGAAYVMSQSPAAMGRVFSDVDVLVPKSSLSDVERALEIHGWITAASGEYDQRYYRKWMHELPPMTHVHRQTALDVHHNILPETARIKTRPESIIDSRCGVAGYDNVFVPSRIDQILHSACHLFHEGEWRNGLRDLSDLDLLLRAHLSENDVLDEVVNRAQQLNLMIPLAYAVRCARRVFDTPVPDGVVESFAHRKWMDGVFIGAMRSAHRSLAGSLTPVAQGALYLRSHWLRMPLRLLLPHLAHQLVARDDKAA